jgi:hypothetical protein
VGEEFAWGEVGVGEGAHGGAQLSHGGCRVDAVADDVADDEGDACAGQGDHVEPVAADPGGRGCGQVPEGRLDRGLAWQPPRQQVALQCDRGVALAGVAVGVVDGDRGPGSDLLSQ